MTPTPHPNEDRERTTEQGPIRLYAASERGSRANDRTRSNKTQFDVYAAPNEGRERTTELGPIRRTSSSAPLPNEGRERLTECGPIWRSSSTSPLPHVRRASELPNVGCSDAIRRRRRLRARYAGIM